MYYNKVCRDVPRTSGIPIELAIVRKKRSFTNAPRYRKVKKETTVVKK